MWNYVKGFLTGACVIWILVTGVMLQESKRRDSRVRTRYSDYGYSRR